MKYKRYVAYLNIVLWWFCLQSHDSIIFKKINYASVTSNIFAESFYFGQYVGSFLPFLSYFINVNRNLAGTGMATIACCDRIPFYSRSSFCFVHILLETIYFHFTDIWKFNIILCRSHFIFISDNDDEGDDKDSVWWILYLLIYIFISKLSSEGYKECFS